MTHGAVSRGVTHGCQYRQGNNAARRMIQRNTIPNCVFRNVRTRTLHMFPRLLQVPGSIPARPGYSTLRAGGSPPRVFKHWVRGGPPPPPPPALMPLSFFNQLLDLEMITSRRCTVLLL